MEAREWYAHYLRRETGIKDALPDEHGMVDFFIEWFEKLALIFLDETG